MTSEEKMRFALEVVDAMPEVSDERLGELMGLRPAVARFWKLRAYAKLGLFEQPQGEVPRKAGFFQRLFGHQ